MTMQEYSTLIHKQILKKVFCSKNTIKAGGSTACAQNVDWVSGVDGYPLDCYDY